MLTKTNKKNKIIFSPIRIAAFLIFFIFIFVISVSAQNNDKKNLPGWQSYRNISIGMTITEVREKLGAPKSEDTEGFFYMFSDSESAQVLFDADKKVKTISVVFCEDHNKPPTFSDVFGKTAVAEPKPDGAIFKMMRYEDLGYWISYNRASGEKAMVIVTIQKF